MARTDRATGALANVGVNTSAARSAGGNPSGDHTTEENNAMWHAIGQGKLLGAMQPACVHYKRSHRRRRMRRGTRGSPTGPRALGCASDGATEEKALPWRSSSSVHHHHQHHLHLVVISIIVVITIIVIIIWS